MTITKSVFILGILVILAKYCQGYKINIVVLIAGENVNYGYYATAPVFEVTFAEMAEKYSRLFANVSVHILYRPNVTDCEDGGAVMNTLAGRTFDLISDKHAFNVLFTPGCSLDLLPIADFAREMDVLLIASNAGDVRLANAIRYPTFVTFAPIGRGGQGPAINAFLQRFSWTTVTMICDRLTDYLNIASFASVICRSIKNQFMLAGDTYQPYIEDFDSNGASLQQYRDMLLRAKACSRVILILSREDVVRKFMVTAFTLGMANADEYVYLYPEPHGQPYLVNLLEPSDHPQDEYASQAFPALIVANLASPNWALMSDLLAKVAHVAQKKYNYTYTHGRNQQLNENALSAFEAVSSFFEVLNESVGLTSNDREALPSARDFRESFLNRTFALRSRNVSLSSCGFPDRTVTFSKFSRVSGAFETTWKYSSKDSILREVSTVLANDWKGNTEPPPNFPPCGYRGRRCTKHISPTEQKLYIIISAIGIILVAALWFTISRLRKSSKRLNENDGFWWRLDGEDICPHHRASVKDKQHYGSSVTSSITDFVMNGDLSVLSPYFPETQPEPADLSDSSKRNSFLFPHNDDAFEDNRTYSTSDYGSVSSGVHA